MSFCALTVVYTLCWKLWQSNRNFSILDKKVTHYGSRDRGNPSTLRNEIFNWVSKIMRDFFTFVLFSSVICPENLRRFLNQSDSKLKPTTTWSPAFSCALLFEFSLAHGVIFFAMVGCCDCFGYSFTTLNRKALWHINVHETIFIYYFVA